MTRLTKNIVKTKAARPCLLECMRLLGRFQMPLINVRSGVSRLQYQDSLLRRTHLLIQSGYAHRKRLWVVDSIQRNLPGQTDRRSPCGSVD